MMINFPGLSKLKTKKIVFEEIFSASDAITLEQFQEMSCRRRLIEESMSSTCVTKNYKRWVQVQLDVEKLEQYLPLLENFAYHVNMFRDNRRVVGWTSELKIRWNSSLCSSCLFQPKSGLKYFQVDDIRFELGMVLFLYGQLLRDNALVLLQTGGGGGGGGDLVQSATLLRKAAGVYQHLAHEILPHLLQTTKASSERPPESLSCVSSVMSLICLAEAQAVSARKAEEKGNAPSLLSKLHYGCKEFLDEAEAVLHSSIKECSSSSSSKTSSKFMDFVKTYGVLHELKSYMYLGESLKADDKIGEAIGVVRQALCNSDKHTPPKQESWRSVYKQLIEDLRKQLKKNEYENNFLEQVKVPNKYDLPSPQSVQIVTSISYQPQRTDKTLVFNL